MEGAKIVTIYDKVFKKILTLSSKAIINLINGLYETDYPLDSTITYNWTEFEDDNLKKILADTIITINGKNSYHLEAQMTKDDDIVFRVLEYGFSHANRSKNTSVNEIIFPEPMIIYLYSEGKIPDEYSINLIFGEQGSFEYKVKVFKYLETTLEEINKKKMIVLIPFQLLKLRKLINKARTPENIEQLRRLFKCDIMETIEENYKLGNITYNDAHKLMRMSKLLYNHIYSDYEELEDLEEMTDESIMFDIDYVEKELEVQIEKRLTEQVTARVTEQVTARVTEQVTAQVTEQVTAQVTEQITAQKDEEIARLKEQIKDLERQLNQQ